MSKELEKAQEYQHLVDGIGSLLTQARQQIAVSVNNTLVQTYWHIGQHIVEYEQQGKAKADYGDELINRLSADLRLRYGKGFSRSNLFTIRQFYLRFPKIQTVSGLLSWSHNLAFCETNEEIRHERIGIFR